MPRKPKPSVVDAVADLAFRGVKYPGDAHGETDIVPEPPVAGVEPPAEAGVKTGPVTKPVVAEVERAEVKRAEVERAEVKRAEPPAKPSEDDPIDGAPRFDDPFLVWAATRGGYKRVDPRTVGGITILSIEQFARDFHGRMRASFDAGVRAAGGNLEDIRRMNEIARLSGE
jgi:hypothetical protein